MTDFFIFYGNQVLLGKSRNVALLLPPSKKDLSFLFRLTKKKIFMDIQLKVKLTGLFWKLPGCPLFPLAE